jgi:uncharacterized protein YjdB
MGGAYSHQTPATVIKVAGSGGASGGIAVTGVTLDNPTLYLHSFNPQQQLAATVSPANASDKSLLWSSSDESVVTVDADGWVHWVPKLYGTTYATITVTTVDGGYTATCEVRSEP